MNKCPKCGAENQLDYIFCHNCGEQLLLPCLTCNKKHLPNLKFCPNNGKNISQAKTEDEAKKQSELQKQLVELQKKKEENEIEKAVWQKYGKRLKFGAWFFGISLLTIFFKWMANLSTGNPTLDNDIGNHIIWSLSCSILMAGGIVLAGRIIIFDYFKKKIKNSKKERLNKSNSFPKQSPESPSIQGKEEKK
ncbi:MAG: zinc ribbon domain-containing protein [Patescibacteria group bacterium]